MEGFSLGEKEKEAVRASFNVTEEDIHRKMETLREWLNSSPELPEESRDEHFLDIMLLRAKFDDDYARKNIGNYFRTIRRYPEIFRSLGGFRLSEEVAVAMACRTLTSAFERVSVLKLSLKNLASRSLDVDQLIKVAITTGTIMFLNDYAASHRFVLDFEGVTFRDLFRINVRTLFKLVNITTDMLRIRISGIEFLNAPGIFRYLLGIARLLLKPKMLARITVHRDLESLRSAVPTECLPADYGGEEANTEDLISIWEDIIEANRPLFEKIARLAETSSSSSSLLD